MAKVIPERFAIVAIDPGTTTGAAAGLFRAAADIKTCLATGDWEAWEVEGSPAEQAWQILEEFRDRQSDWNIRGVSLEHIYLCCESFQLRISKAHGAASDKRMLDSIRVISAMEALCLYQAHKPGEWVQPWIRIEFRPPSSAKKYVTNERLRRWGGWVVGSEHKRDAMRHLISKVSDLL